MSLLSKYTLNIKSILTEKVIDVIADIILQYTGSYVNLFEKRDDDTAGLHKHYFLTSNVLAACIHYYNTAPLVHFSIKNNIGLDEKKAQVKKYIRTEEYVFYEELFLEPRWILQPCFDVILMNSEQYLNIEKSIGITVIKTSNDCMKYINKCTYSAISAYHSKILNKKEYEQFVNDFRGICEAIFDITKKIDS
jgi:hypothetical protein